MKRPKQARRVATRIAVATFLLCSALPTAAQRSTQTVNDHWKFLKGECPAAADSAYDDSSWTDIHLPHTWNTDAYTDKEYYRGTGWYRRRISLPESWQGKQVFLKLDAASKAAILFVNGKNIGEHAGGYTACTFNITPFLSFSSPNVLAVRVDNARMDIPPISGDFTFFGGIYRDAWLITTPAQHFNLTNHGSDGIFISTPQVSEKRATLSVRGEIRNDADKKVSLELTHAIIRLKSPLIRGQYKSYPSKSILSHQKRLFRKHEASLFLKIQTGC